MIRCPKCGYENFDDAMNCRNCRINLQFALANPDQSIGSPVQTPVEPTERIQEDSIPPLSLKKAYPWIRLFSRTTDYWIAGCIIGLIHTAVTPRGWTFGVIYVYALFFLLTIVEAVLLSTWGTTPGKWIFNITIRDSMGKKVGFFSALRRCWWVWSLGLGFCLPILSPLALVFSYYKVKRHGSCWWDNKGHYSVSCKKLGVLGVLFTGLMCLLCFTLVLLPVLVLVTGVDVYTEAQKAASYIDRNSPLVTFTDSQGDIRILIGGNVIRALFFRYPPLYSTTVFVPHLSAGIVTVLQLVQLFRG